MTPTPDELRQTAAALMALADDPNMPCEWAHIGDTDWIEINMAWTNQLSGSPAREQVKKLGLAACYLRTAANFTEKGWLKEAYMEAEQSQRLLKDVIEAKPKND